MTLTLVGFNYRTAPVEVRERLAWSTQELPEVLELVSGAGRIGTVILSTCNRTEFYLSEPQPDTMDLVWEQTEQRIGVPPKRYSYLESERDVVNHLFRVASGLDSMLLGESQIQGQVRDAWEHSKPVAGPVLNRLFQSALRTGGRVRAETGIGEGAASIPGASLTVARKIFGDLGGRTALVFGTGEMGELALASLVSEGVRPILVTHRNVERAEKVAAQYDGRTVSAEQAWQVLDESDLVLCSTAATEPIITVERIKEHLAHRRRPVCILDIAVPRDVEPGVGDLDNVFLYDIDSLQSVMSAATGKRKREIPRAEKIVDEEVKYFWHWYRGRDAVAVIQAFRHRLDAIRKSEIERTFKSLGHLAEEDRERVEHLTYAIMQKFLHDPTIRLKDADDDTEHARLTYAIRKLFDLGSGSDSDSED